MREKITLTMQDILEKEFKIDARGYRLQEVDKFLDIIIKDYNEYNNIINNNTRTRDLHISADSYLNRLSKTHFVKFNF